MNMPVSQQKAMQRLQPSQLPAAFQPLAQTQGNKEITSGVTSGFPIISFRGKVWRVRKSGVEQNYVNDEGEAMPSIEIVLIKAHSMPSKTFYDTQFEEGANTPPRCWSADGVKPDAGVEQPIHSVCATCPKNAWGSKMTPSGAKSRACSDVRRVAVVFLHELEEKGRDATLLLLRIPPASLNPLKDYAEKVLEPRGLQYFMLGTRVGFDTQTAHPKLTFKPKRFLNEEEAEAVVALRDSEDVRRILAEATEFEAAGTTGSGEVTGGTHATPEDAPTPAASGPSRKAKQRPAEEEDFEEPTVVPAPTGRKAAAPPPEPEEDEPEAPPPPKAAKKKAAPVPPPAAVEEEEEDEPEAAPPPPKAAKKKAAPPPPPPVEEPAGEEDFDTMLDSILKPVRA